MTALETLKKGNRSNIEASNYDDLIDFLPNFSNKNIDNKLYIGSYKNSTIGIEISLKEKQLYAQMDGEGGLLKLIPKTKHVFIVEGIKERVKFILNNKDEVVRLKGLDSPMELMKVTTQKE